MRLKFLLLLILSIGVVIPGPGRAQSGAPAYDERPKLVVGIVVDQMRYEYLPRFWEQYGSDGFRRLVEEGYTFRNNHFNYFPTYTGPGHAAIYTGTTPSVNGIVGNSWYQRRDKAGMYVVSDSTVRAVGGQGEVGQMSPANLLSSTVTDEIKKGIPGSKVIAVSIKDRGAVLPAGHLGDGAYWYDDDTGRFITSSWYRDSLPQWVRDFNGRQLPAEYSRQEWKPLLEMNEYTQSNADSTAFEGPFADAQAPVFPHPMGGSRSRIKTSPYGNTLVNKLARAAVEGAGLGADDVTDFLGVSFSSTDYVGHRFGPNSIEVQDTYLRLDREIAELLNYLDQQVGEGRYVVFLTSDHGVVDVPASLRARGLPGGMFDSRTAIDSLDAFLRGRYGQQDWIERYTNQQVYLNRDAIRETNSAASLPEMQRAAARFLRRFEGVANTNTAYNYENEAYSTGIDALFQRGHHPKRSGDVYIQLSPGWLDTGSSVGTSHGSPYTYDTHVPLLFYGWKVPRGSTNRRTVIPQIAPTLSDMLHIEFPSGTDAQMLPFE